MTVNESWVPGIACLDVYEGHPRWPAKNRFYDAFLNWFDCGPSDGGCLVMAQAIQSVRGGDLWVIQGAVYGHEVLAQHAVVRLSCGRFADAYGEGDARQIIENFRRLSRELRGCKLDLRPIREGDLSDAVECQEDRVRQLACLWHSMECAPQAQMRTNRPMQ